MRKLFTITAAFFLLAGCALFLSQKELDDRYGPNPPVIEAVYVADYMSPPELPRVYVRASDPDGDMKAINYEIEPAGPHQVSYGSVFVNGKGGRELSGYLWVQERYQGGFAHLRSRGFRGTLRVEDKAGHQSGPVSFIIRAYAAGPRAAERPPELARFEEIALGPIQYELDWVRE